MLYLIIKKTLEYEDIYHMYESNTESTIIGNSTIVRKLVNKCKMEAKNMLVTNSEITVKPWPNALWKPFTKDYTFTLLCKLNEQTFKLVRYDGAILYVSAKELMSYIESNKIVNCVIENGNYKSIDTYDISINNKFKQKIDQAYEVFRAKTLMLGLDMSFEYTIENREVKINKYTGTSLKVIVPNFITTICTGAFRNRDISELRINDGLKYVGASAFAYNNIAKVEIPKTVRFIGHKAFDKNHKLIESSGEYRDAIKMLGRQTVRL